MPQLSLAYGVSFADEEGKSVPRVLRKVNMKHDSGVRHKRRSEIGGIEDSQLLNLGRCLQNRVPEREPSLARKSGVGRERKAANRNSSIILGLLFLESDQQASVDRYQRKTRWGAKRQVGERAELRNAESAPMRASMVTEQADIQSDLPRHPMKAVWRKEFPKEFLQ
ncbi:hypothetical protein B0H34DRAFT_837847 [Crassisporium funariophilum]|nr:hypothetical protein B0H34DRAFT_837847 [Crassisporium funariophilum]